MTDLRTQILEVKDVKISKIDVPQWPGVDVYIKQWTAKEQDVYAKECVDKTGEFEKEYARARLVASALCDEHGTKLFTDKDYEVLSGKSVAALDYIITNVNKLNGLSTGQLEDLGKN